MAHFGFVALGLTLASLPLVTASSCNANIDPSTTRPQQEAAMFFGGYNQILGMPVNQHRLFNDSGILASLGQMHVGGLRYPGGTQANYFNISSADFVKPCSLAGEKGGYICNEQDVLQQWPPGTASLGNYYNDISTKLVGGSENMVYVLNLLTQSGEDLYRQVDTLVNSVPLDKIKYIELGNEYYLPQYRSQLPNASSYMAMAIALKQYIKQRIPHAMVSVPVCDSADTWNQQMMQFRENITVVTIHDYSEGYHPSGKGFSQHLEEAMETLAGTVGSVPNWVYQNVISWGWYRIPTISQMVAHEFGHDVKIFNSEFDVRPTFDEVLGYKALRAIFALNYKLAAFCQANQTWQKAASL